MSTATDHTAAGLFGIELGTPSETVMKAATIVQKRTFTEQVEYLLTTVGPRITAAGAGLRDARQLASWRRGEEPRQDVNRVRVAALAEVTTVIMAGYPASVAASFLRSSQPVLDDASPMVMIREAGEDEMPKVMGQVRAAVRAFLEG